MFIYLLIVRKKPGGSPPLVLLLFESFYLNLTIFITFFINLFQVQSKENARKHHSSMYPFVKDRDNNVF